MIVGPVFHFELVRIARRRQFFLLRFGFGLILLGVLGFNYFERLPWLPYLVFGSAPSRDTLTLGELADFGRAIFGSLMAAEIALVIGLTPGLVADAISAERHRKTLHYLMASPLTSLEIVLGKLAARLSYIAIFLAVILPVTCLLTLFGGVDPNRLLMCYLALGSTAYMLAALAIFGSVLARRPRDSLAAAYALGFGWLFMPAVMAMVLALLPANWTELSHAIHEVADWILPSSPLELLMNLLPLMTGGEAEFLRRLWWMIVLQCVYGTLVVGASVWRLRPAFRRHEGHAVRTRRSVRRRLRVPPCGENPVYWREAHFARAGGGAGRVMLRLLLFVFLLTALAGTVLGSMEAFKELRQHGYGYGGSAQYMQRLAFNFGLRYGGAILFAIWMLSLAGTSAATITSEREQDTWISLLATPLDGPTIVKGKMLAAVRSSFPFAATLGLIWAIGLAAGAIHPIGVLFATGSAALFIWFVTALGTYASLKANTTWRARAVAQGIILVPHFCCCLVPSFSVLLTLSLLSYAEVSEFFFGTWWPIRIDAMVVLTFAYFVGGYVAYVAAAYFLTRAAFRQFDRVADRPRRAGPSRGILKPIPKPGPTAEV